MNQTTKRCTKCRKVKPLSEFYKSRKYLRSECKPCYVKLRAKWVAENPKRAAEIKAKWVAENSERYRELHSAGIHNYLARQRENGGSHTADEWLALKSSFDFCCVKCGLPADPGNPISRDHIVPVSLGGSNNISNIQPLHKNCNSSKGANHVDYRNSKIGRMLKRRARDKLKAQSKLVLSATRS